MFDILIYLFLFLVIVTNWLFFLWLFDFGCMLLRNRSSWLMNRLLNWSMILSGLGNWMRFGCGCRLLLRFFLMLFLMFYGWLLSCFLCWCNFRCFLLLLRFLSLLFSFLRLSSCLDWSLSLLANYFLRVDMGGSLVLLFVCVSFLVLDVLFLASIGLSLVSSLSAIIKSLPFFTHTL